MPRPALVLLAAFALFPIGACGGSVPATQMRLHVTAPESDAPQPVDGRLARRLVAQGAVLLDVRSPVEHLIRHIDGSRNIPVDELRGRLDELGEPDTPVVVYCLSGERSGRAARVLSEAGFTRVYDVGSMFSY